MVSKLDMEETKELRQEEMALLLKEEFAAAELQILFYSYHISSSFKGLNFH